MEHDALPGVQMLHALGVSESVVLDGLVLEARDQLARLLPQLPPARLAALATQMFTHAERPELRPLVFAALEAADPLPPPIVAALVAARRELLAAMPLRVRRRVWEASREAFFDETHPSILDRIEAADGDAHALLSATPRDPRRRRRECASIQRLRGLAASPPLYATLVELLRQLFAQTEAAAERRALAMVRLDVAMALHESEAEEAPVAAWDADFAFLTCVDAAVRAHSLDGKLLRRVAEAMHGAGMPRLDGGGGGGGGGEGGGGAGEGGGEGAGEGGVARLAGMAMVLTPLPCVHLLANAAMRRVERVVEERTLPARDGELAELVQMLTLAEMAGPLAMGRSVQETVWRSTMAKILHHVMPLQAQLVAADLICEVHRSTDQAASPPPPAAQLTKLLCRLPLAACRRIFLLYCARRLEAADAPRLAQVLPIAREVLRSHAGLIEQNLDFVRALVDCCTRQPPSAEILEAVVEALLLPLAEASAAAHAELLQLFESLCQPQVRAQLPGGADTLRLLSGLVESSRERGACADASDEAHSRDKFGAAYAKVQAALQSRV